METTVWPRETRTYPIGDYHAGRRDFRFYRKCASPLPCRIDNHCSVPLCTSNKTTTISEFPYSFPNEVKLRKKWVRAIQREEGPDFITVMCVPNTSLHSSSHETRATTAASLDTRQIYINVQILFLNKNTFNPSDTGSAILNLVLSRASLS